jgi:hypothetical protein
MVGEIVADPSTINELESHIDKPHGIADLTYLYTHKNLWVATLPLVTVCGVRVQYRDAGAARLLTMATISLRST